MMNPVDVITQLLRTNRQVGQLILLIIAVPAAAAVIAGFNIDPRTAGITTLYLAGIAVVLTMVSRMISDREGAWQRFVLSWFLVVFLILASCVLGLAAVRRPPPFGIAPIECLVRFWEPCGSVRDAVVDRNFPGPAAPVPAVAATAGAEAVRHAAYRVFVQFAGTIRREDVQAMMLAMRADGWNVQGAESGGERTPAAAGLTEVRYAQSADEAAAVALARLVQARSIVARQVVPRLAVGVAAGTLEVWISR